jgi:protocatechuate 3,4-dioxygenase alpha subunit
MRRNRLIATAEEMVGPYYPPTFLDADRNDLSKWAGLSVVPDGDVIELTGTIRDNTGQPVAPVLVEFWVANPAGHYERGGSTSPWFEGLGRHYCEDGVYRLTTVRPGSVEGRAVNVTVTIFCDGLSRLVTQIFFDDDPALGDDALLASVPSELRDRLVAAQEGTSERPLYRRDIILSGDGETPFFDDRDDL